MIKFHKQTRIQYWSSSRTSKWLRKKAGLESPNALSWQGWKEHKKESKDKAPFIHWLTDRGFNKLQNIVLFPSDCFYSVKVFYKNWKGKSHVLDGDLEVGRWYDLCGRIPKCLFNELVKFVEQEKSLETLEWEIGLVYDESYGVKPEDENYGKPTPQALAAMEQKRIYRWWLDNKDRNFYKESGWSDAVDKRGDDLFGDTTEENKALEKEALDKLNALEAEYDKQEETNLIALIRIRNSLWS